MENNQPAVPIIPQPTPEAATFVNPEQPAKAGSSKMMMIIIAVVLVLLALGGGVFYWMSTQKPVAEEVKVEEQPVSIETSDLNSELEATQPTDLDADFSEIDKDLQSL